MSAVVKGAVGVVVPAAVAGGTFFYLRDINENMPEWKPLKTVTNGKFGKDYQPYLADDSESENDDWWQWSFVNFYEPDRKKENPDLSNAFQDIEGFTGLKAKCKEAYGKVTSTELTATNSSDDKAKHGRDAWRYCSKFGGKPATIEDNSGAGKSDENNLKSDGKYYNKIGADKKSELVSVTDESEANKKFWLEREIEFFGPKDVDGLGKYDEKQKSTTEKKNVFDQHYDYKGRVEVTGEKLKEVCGKAYEQDKGQTSDGNVKDEDAVKFCGLKPQVNK